MEGIRYSDIGSTKENPALETDQRVRVVGRGSRGRLRLPEAERRGEESADKGKK